LHAIVVAANPRFRHSENSSVEHPFPFLFSTKNSLMLPHTSWIHPSVAQVLTFIDTASSCSLRPQTPTSPSYWNGFFPILLFVFPPPLLVSRPRVLEFSASSLFRSHCCLLVSHSRLHGRTLTPLVVCSSFLSLRSLCEIGL